MTGALLASLPAVLGSAQAQTAAGVEGAEDSGSEQSASLGGFSFGDAMSHVFLKAVEGPFGLGDASEGEGAVCGDPASKAALPEQVLETFSAKLERSWERLAGDEIDTRSLMLEVCLGASGESLRRPFLVNPSGALQPEEAATLLKALDAVAEAAPLLLPTPQEGPWRRILVLFDPVKGERNARNAGK